MVETAEAKQVCRGGFTVVYPALDFDINPCGGYTGADFEKRLSRVAFEQEFANTTGKPANSMTASPSTSSDPQKCYMRLELGPYWPDKKRRPVRHLSEEDLDRLLAETDHE